ncbi:Imm3 family immunity protein [Bacillus luti]|uniref:Uncharacterized protein n=1 Tax=Bacillus luti TaxID=2026191 RepID=A0A7V7V4H0_9BACI|nr:hypothetical protein F8163_19630 [Bacillus luti]
MKDWEYNELFHAIREVYEERGDRYAIAKLADEFDNNWGNCETVKVEYNRQEIIEKVISERRVSEVHLYRDKTVH